MTKITNSKGGKSGGTFYGGITSKISFFGWHNDEMSFGRLKENRQSSMFKVPDTYGLPLHLSFLTGDSLL